MATVAQKAAAQERREKMKALADHVAALTEDQRLALIQEVGLVTSITGHPMSPKNTCMLALQNAAVSVVGGFRQWLDAGRCVRKGEKALAIWVPVEFKKGEDTDEKKTGFVIGNVFDVSQTDPIEQ